MVFSKRRRHSRFLEHLVRGMSKMGTKCRGAGRPRCFDPEDVLERAGAIFWNKGYASTSLNELTRATGLNKGSLYSAFGDKRTLFLQCLRRYLNEHLESLKDTLHGEDPKESLLQVFSWVNNPEAAGPRGCLALNSLTELGPHDAAVKQMLDEHLESVESLLAEAIRVAQEKGSFGPFSAELAARTLCSVMLAMKARARSHQLDKVDELLGPFVIELLSQNQDS